MASRYRSAYTKNTFISAATIALVAGQYNKLGEYKVQAGENVEIGYGGLSGMDNAVGRIYGVFKDTSGTPVEIKGTLRLSVYSPQDRPLDIVFELRTEALNTSNTDRTKQTPLPEQGIILTEDKKYVLEFLPDAAATLSKANSDLVMDITQGVA